MYNVKNKSVYFYHTNQHYSNFFINEPWEEIVNLFLEHDFDRNEYLWEGGVQNGYGEIGYSFISIHKGP
jgi:hypothetical protein